MHPPDDIVAILAENAALRAQNERLRSANTSLAAIVSNGDVAPADESKTWREVFRLYSSWYAAERRASSSVTMHTQSRALLASAFVDKPIAKLTWGDLDAHKARRRAKLTPRKRPIAETTLDLEICLALTVINWAAKEGRRRETGVVANPVAGYPMRTQRRKGGAMKDRVAGRRQPYTYEQEERILAEVTHPALRAVIALVANFFRPSEALATERTQYVDVGDGWRVVELRGDQTKNGLPRSIPISPERMAHVRALPGWASRARYPFENPGTGKPFTLYHLERMFKTAATASGVHRTDGRPVDLYAFRATAATRALDAGVPLTTVAELMGHQDAGKTIQDHYNDVNDAARIRAVSTMEAARSPHGRKPPLRSLPVPEGTSENRTASARK